VSRQLSSKSDKLQEALIKLDDSIEFSAMKSFIPRSGNDLQPNVAVRRLRWGEARVRGHNPIGVEVR
jgi:hypothetical protein